jgi:hypothetical protein
MGRRQLALLRRAVLLDKPSRRLENVGASPLAESQAGGRLTTPSRVMKSRLARRKEPYAWGLGRSPNPHVYEFFPGRSPFSSHSLGWEQAGGGMRAGARRPVDAQWHANCILGYNRRMLTVARLISNPTIRGPGHPLDFHQVLDSTSDRTAELARKAHWR